MGGPQVGQDGMGDLGEAGTGWGTHGEARIGWGTHSGARMRGPRPVDTGVLVPGTPSCADWEVCCHTALFIDDQRAFLFPSGDLTIVPAGSSLHLSGGAWERLREEAKGKNKVFFHF